MLVLPGNSSVNLPLGALMEWVPSSVRAAGVALPIARRGSSS
jgi:hypothetical protein